MVSSNLIRFTALFIVLVFSAQTVFAQGKAIPDRERENIDVTEMAKKAKLAKEAADKFQSQQALERERAAKLSKNSKDQFNASTTVAEQKLKTSRFGQPPVNFGDAKSISADTTKRNKEIVASTMVFIEEVGSSMAIPKSDLYEKNGVPKDKLLKDVYNAITALHSINGTPSQNKWRDLSLIKIQDVIDTLRQGRQTTSIGADVVNALARGLRGANATNFTDAQSAEYEEIFGAIAVRIKELLQATRDNPAEFNNDQTRIAVEKARNGVLEILENTANNVKNNPGLSYREAYIQGIEKYATDHNMDQKDRLKVRKCMMKIAGI